MFASNLVASWVVNRLIIQPGDPNTTPLVPVPEIKDSDDALRLRGLLARDGLSVAGLTGAYEFFALSVDGRVVGAKGTSPSPSVAVVTLLSTEDNSRADAALSGEDIHPIGDLTV